MRGPRGHVTIHGNEALRPRVATAHGDLNLIVRTHGAKPDSGKSATVLSILVGTEETNKNFHRDADVLVSVVAVMKFCNADACVLRLPGGEAGWNLDLAFLAVGSHALDDVFHGFIACVILTVACEEVGEGDLEFLHVITDITRIGPHLNTIRLDGNIHR